MPIKRILKLLPKILVVVISLLFMINCQQEDDTHLNADQPSKTPKAKTVSASEIPMVMQFLESKSNKRLEFIIDDSNSELGMHRSHEENLSITSVLQEEIKVLTNSYGKSNYTFTLIEEQTKAGIYFLNLVVKEYKDEFYMYIIKYVPDASWLSTYVDETSLSDFSGDLYLYNEEGIYVAKVNMLNGSSTLITKDPCDTNTSNSGGSGSGSGSTSSSGSSSSSVSNGGGGSGGFDIECMVIEVSWDDSCTCQTAVVHPCDDYFNPDKSMRSLLRNPCLPDLPEECFDAVGDPCPHGCDADGNCVEDSEEIENSGVGIDIDLGEMLFTSFVNTLTEEQQQFLEDHPEIEEEIFLFLVGHNFSDEAKIFSEELIILMSEDDEADTNAFNFIIEAYKQDKIYNAFDSEFLLSTNQYTVIDFSDENHVLPFYLNFVMKCHVLRALNPEWSEAKIFYYAVKDGVHIALDVFGMIPVVGELADVTNGVLYLIEGDGVNATLSFAATIPIIGIGSTATKYGIKIIEASNLAGKVKLVWKITAEGVDFGYSGKLRKVLGLTDSNFQAHHIIPWAKRDHPVVQKAAQSSHQFHMNEALNGVPLHTDFHLGSHPHYNNQIQQYLDAIPENFTPDQTFDAINTLINNIRTTIQNNPTTHINQLNF